MSLSRYLIKWREGEKWRFGIFLKQTENTVLVDDAIKPINVSIPATEALDVDPSGYPNEYTFLDQACDEAYKRSEALGEGLRVGKVFHLPVADGSAHYEVVAVKPRTVTVEWRGFCADRWTDHWLGWGGSFSKAKIAEIIRREEGMRKLFAAVPDPRTVTPA